MRTRSVKPLLLLTAALWLTAPCVAQTAAAPQPASSAAPQPASSAAPTPASKPAKKHSGSIDTNETAGVRDSGYTVTVHVRVNGKAAADVSVVARNPDATAAGTCTTKAEGRCSVQIGEGDYNVSASRSGYIGSRSFHAGAATKMLTIVLHKVGS